MTINIKSRIQTRWTTRNLNYISETKEMVIMNNQDSEIIFMPKNGILNNHSLHYISQVQAAVSREPWITRTEFLKAVI